MSTIGDITLTRTEAQDLQSEDGRRAYRVSSWTARYGEGQTEHVVVYLHTGKLKSSAAARGAATGDLQGGLWAKTTTLVKVGPAIPDDSDYGDLNLPLFRAGSNPTDFHCEDKFRPLIGWGKVLATSHKITDQVWVPVEEYIKAFITRKEATGSESGADEFDDSVSTHGDLEEATLDEVLDDGDSSRGGPSMEPSSVVSPSELARLGGEEEEDRRSVKSHLSAELVAAAFGSDAISSSVDDWLTEFPRAAERDGALPPPPASPPPASPTLTTEPTVKDKEVSVVKSLYNRAKPYALIAGSYIGAAGLVAAFAIAGKYTAFYYGGQ